jgi:hypothetical protein
VELARHLPGCSPVVSIEPPKERKRLLGPGDNLPGAFARREFSKGMRANCGSASRWSRLFDAQHEARLHPWGPGTRRFGAGEVYDPQIRIVTTNGLLASRRRFADDAILG